MHNKNRKRGSKDAGVGGGRWRPSDKVNWADSIPAFPFRSSPGGRTEARDRNKFFRKEKEMKSLQSIHGSEILGET
jgi:hypothetical protein